MTTMTETAAIETRISHVSDLDADLIPDVEVAKLVGQTIPYRVEGGLLPADFDPKATVTRAWIDADGWICVELSITY